MTLKLPVVVENVHIDICTKVDLMIKILIIKNKIMLILRNL